MVVTQKYFGKYERTRTVTQSPCFSGGSVNVFKVSSSHYDSYETLGYFTDWDEAVEYAMCMSLRDLLIDIGDWFMKRENEPDDEDEYLLDYDFLAQTPNGLYWQQHDFFVNECTIGHVPIDSDPWSSRSTFESSRSMSIQHGYDTASDFYCAHFDRDGRPYE